MSASLRVAKFRRKMSSRPAPVRSFTVMRRGAWQRHDTNRRPAKFSD